MIDIKKPAMSTAHIKRIRRRYIAFGIYMVTLIIGGGAVLFMAQLPENVSGWNLGIAWIIATVCLLLGFGHAIAKAMSMREAPVDEYPHIQLWLQDPEIAAFRDSVANQDRGFTVDEVISMRSYRQSKLAQEAYDAVYKKGTKA